MKLVDNILYLEMADAVDCGIERNTILVAKSRGSKAWHFAEDPSDRRRVLIGYEKLSLENKKKVEARFGNPYNHVARQPLLDMVRTEPAAHAFFFSYQYERAGVPTHLNATQVAQCTRAAAWLRLIGKVSTSAGWKEVRATMGLRSIPDFFGHASALIQLEVANGKKSNFTGAQQLPGNFPASYQRLKEKAATFAERDFEYCLPLGLGNKAAAKVEEHEAGPALLRELLRHPNQYDNVFIREAYNTEARKHGWKEISKDTVQVWRSKWAAEITAGREGWAEWNKIYGKGIQRYRPDAMQIWESDDNHLDLHFRDDAGNPYRRLKGIFVQDSSVDLTLGYCLTAGEITPLQVRLAYISAMYYIRQLTGGQCWYVPHEVKTDRYGLKALRPFYESFAHYQESARGSKNRGWQENYFGTENWKRCLKTGMDGAPATNYTGNNVTALSAGYNPEYHRAMEKYFPSFEAEADAQVAAFVNRLRAIDLHQTGSAEARWLEKWNALPETEKRPYSDAQFLAAFGLKHEPGNGARNEITKMGVKATLPGGRMTYAVPQEHYLHNVGKKVDVYYDPFDLSRVLITDGANLRFVAYTVELAAPGLRAAQLQPGSRRLLHRLLEEKRQNVDKVAGRQQADREIAAAWGIDPESALKLPGMLPKGIAQAAADRYLGDGAAHYTEAHYGTYGGGNDEPEGAFDPGQLM